MNWLANMQRVTRLPVFVKSVTTGSSSTRSLVTILAKGGIGLVESVGLERKLGWRAYGLYGSGGKMGSKNNNRNLYSKFDRSMHTGPDLSRDFLVQLWVADAKTRKAREKREPKAVENTVKIETVVSTDGGHGSSETRTYHYDYSPVGAGSVEYGSPEEASLAPLLSRSNLIITRSIEWANLTFGFEQENRYAIVDVNNPQVPAGFIREESNVIFRQLLRTRRPFVAIITDGNGNELFRVRRPFWWLTSSIYAEVGGKEIGVVHRRWHLWRRIYDLYLGNEQFAVVENPGFWYWTFTLKGVDGEVLAEIDRDWRGFGFEVFTDAGQYVIRFGSAAGISELSKKVEEFEVARPLTLLERAVTVALAVSLDNDYFSRHGGWGVPFMAVGE